MPWLPSGDLPDAGVEPVSPTSPAVQVDFFTTSVTWEALYVPWVLSRIARRDRKTSLSDQCKEIEENNRMGKIRDLFKKIRDTKGTFHAKMGSMKDRNGMDLTEVDLPWWLRR